MKVINADCHTFHRSQPFQDHLEGADTLHSENFLCSPIPVILSELFLLVPSIAPALHNNGDMAPKPRFTDSSAIPEAISMKNVLFESFLRFLRRFFSFFQN